MNRIGVKIDLDTGDLVSSAGRARQSIAGLTEEMQKADKEGRHIDYSLLSFEKERLQAKTAGFEKDIKTLYNDPRIQTQTPAGAPALKMDSEYANLIKSHTEAMRKLTDEYHEAARGGNIERIRELTPRIERQQSEFHKTVRDIINTGGDFSKRPAVEDSALPGGLPKQYVPQGDGWKELKGLSGSIKQAHDTENWEQVAKLGAARDSLQSVIGQFDRDTENETKLKADPEFASQLKDIRDALKATIAALNEAAANDDLEEVDRLTGQAKQLQNASRNMIEANSPSAVQGGKDAQKALSTFLNVQTAQQIVGAVTSGINTYVAHLDRSGIVNAMGGGDPMGAQIEELHRSAAEKSNLWGSIGRIGGGILGGIIGTFVAPGAGTAAGAALGSTLLGAGGDLIGTLGDEKKANEMATNEAYAKQWERQAPDATQLGAILGVYGGSTEENTRNLRTAFDHAARAANEFGYSAGEGMETIKQAAMQGLDYDESLAAARKIYDFERGTGADRGTLTSFETQMVRYGEKDALGAAWQGREASGLETGQYSEFLRSVQRIFEDGISKGFVRGAKEISESLVFLSDLNGGSELWKGEQGANRLSQMNSSIEQTTNLASTTDILSYRGAQNVLKRYKTEDWKKLLDVDNNGTEDIKRGRGGSEYVNAMMVLERGLTPELFNEQMRMFNTAERGDYASVIERMRKAYGLDYTQSGQLYKSWEQNKNTPGYFDSEAFARELEKYSAKPPEHSTAETKMFSNVETIKTKVSEIGMYYHDKKAPEIQTILIKMIQEAAQTPAASPEMEDDKPEEPRYKTQIGASSEESALLTQEAHAAGDFEKADEHNRRWRQQSYQEEMKAKLAFVDAGKFASGFKDITKYLFAEFTPRIFGGERKEMDAVNDTVFDAMDSGNETQKFAAMEFYETISRLDRNTLKSDQYDKENTFNDLVKFAGDMIKMNEKLQSLMQAIDAAADKYNNAEVIIN